MPIQPAVKGNIQRLETALMPRFPEEEAALLAKLLDACLVTGRVAFEHIGLPDSQKQDSILAAFEERMLIPIMSGRSSAWEDRTLLLRPGEMYFMPPVVQNLLEEARKSGKLDPDKAVRKCFSQEGRAQINDLVCFFQQVRHHAAARTMEAGLMAAIMSGLGICLDLHDVIDRFVVFGMISPCIRTPMSAGLAWYEINASLYRYDGTD